MIPIPFGHGMIGFLSYQRSNPKLTHHVVLSLVLKTIDRVSGMLHRRHNGTHCAAKFQSVFDLKIPSR